MRWYDNKRWYEGPNKSVGYGHPSIPHSSDKVNSHEVQSILCKNKPIKCAKAVKRKNACEPGEDYTYDRRKKCKLTFD